MLHTKENHKANDERKLMILILFIFPFLNYCELPVIWSVLEMYGRATKIIWSGLEIYGQVLDSYD